MVCGWCARLTSSADRCSACGHEDPARPWRQRGMEPPTWQAQDAGRPTLDVGDVRRRLADGRRQLGDRPATVEALAEALDVSPRTVRRWQKMAG
jgi:ribosome-binding protein aMBF1 (putative translation factor)